MLLDIFFSYYNCFHCLTYIFITIVMCYNNCYKTHNSYNCEYFYKISVSFDLFYTKYVIYMYCAYRLRVSRKIVEVLQKYSQSSELTLQHIM